MIKLVSPILGHFLGATFLVVILVIAPSMGLSVSLQFAPLILGLIYGAGIVSFSIWNKFTHLESLDAIQKGRNVAKIINLIAVTFVLVSTSIAWTEKTASILFNGICGYSFGVLLVLSWVGIIRKQKITWDDI
jgi:hypothetical protein